MSVLSIFALFLRMGAFTFGGGIVMLGYLEKELRSTGRIPDEEIAGMMVLATAFPGPIAVNISFMAGKRLAGTAGAAAAVLGAILPPFLTILLLSDFLLRYMGQPLAASFFLGASCAVAVIVGQVVWGMARISLTGGWRDILVFSAVAVMLLGLRVPPFAALGSGLLIRLVLGRGKTS